MKASNLINPNNQLDFKGPSYILAHSLKLSISCCIEGNTKSIYSNQSGQDGGH